VGVGVDHDRAYVVDLPKARRVKKSVTGQ